MFRRFRRYNRVNAVHPTGDLLRFYVSSTRPGVPPHFVDLKAWFLNGQCDCEFFQYHCGPHLSKRRGLSAADWLKMPPIVCKHIKAAQQYAFREWLQKLCQGQTLTESGE